MRAVLSRDINPREELARRGIKPRDHERDNKLKIKQLQTLNRARAAEAACIAPKRLAAKYACIGSRVAAELSRSARSAQAHSNLSTRSAATLRNFACPKPDGPAGRHVTAWAPPAFLNEGGPEPPHREKRKAAVPPNKPHTPRAAAVDFVKRNAELSSLTPRMAKVNSPSSPTTQHKSKFHGRLPPYLLDRKLELARVKAAREAANAPRECPEGTLHVRCRARRDIVQSPRDCDLRAGTRVLSEDERVRVLALVRKAQEKAHGQLDAMPFVIDTFGLKAKHEVLTRQLAQLAAAETAFSRRKVVVANDGPAPAELVVQPVDAVAISVPAEANSAAPTWSTKTAVPIDLLADSTPGEGPIDVTDL